MDIRYGGMQGVTPIITGPFNGPGYESLSMRREHVHVKIDLTSIPPSAKNYFGAHIGRVGQILPRVMSIMSEELVLIRLQKMLRLVPVLVTEHWSIYG